MSSQEFEDFFGKRLDSKYFYLSRPYFLCLNYSTRRCRMKAVTADTGTMGVAVFPWNLINKNWQDKTWPMKPEFPDSWSTLYSVVSRLVCTLELPEGTKRYVCLYPIPKGCDLISLRYGLSSGNLKSSPGGSTVQACSGTTALRCFHNCCLK